MFRFLKERTETDEGKAGRVDGSGDCGKCEGHALRSVGKGE